MKFGITTYVTDQVIGPAALARAVEERGFDSLFVGEHMHRPVPGQLLRTLDPS